MKILSVIILLGLSGAALATGSGRSTKFIDSKGKAVGTAQLRNHGGTPMVIVKATGLTPGSHGFHIHPVGKCNLPDFSEAKTHWNPLNHQHGKNNPMGAHMGDLNNITADAKGVAKASMMLDGISLTGDNALLDADGFALILHTNPDDYTADPSGNSGTKIACAAFAPT